MNCKTDIWFFTTPIVSLIHFSLRLCLPFRNPAQTFEAADTDQAYFSSVAKVVKAAAVQSEADREVA